jgi:hypothetical protein
MEGAGPGGRGRKRPFSSHKCHVFVDGGLLAAERGIWAADNGRSLCLCRRVVSRGAGAGATFVRPDGLLLGLLLLGLALAQGRKRAAYGAAVFLVPLLAVWSGRIALGHDPPTLPRWDIQTEALHWLWIPATALLLWLLLPFCAEMSEVQRRARWLPVVLWSGLALADASTLSCTTPTGTLLTVMPPLFALAGGGLSRLLPTLAGEFPRPAVRYTLAVLAVLGLVGMHVRLEPKPSAPPTFSPAHHLAAG